MKYLKIYEVLYKASNAAATEEKIAILKENDSLALRDVLRASFDDSIIFTLPAGIPGYKSALSNEGLAPTDLRRVTTRFTYFVKGGEGEKLRPEKRESMFMAILEGVHPEDANVVCQMKEKTLGTKFPGITKDLVKTVWPKLIAK